MKRQNFLVAFFNSYPFCMFSFFVLKSSKMCQNYEYAFRLLYLYFSSRHNFFDCMTSILVIQQK